MREKRSSNSRGQLMGRLRYLTAGESHGRALVAILEGLPAGVPVSIKAVADELARRRHGYGRGPRMKIDVTLWTSSPACAVASR